MSNYSQDFRNIIADPVEPVEYVERTKSIGTAELVEFVEPRNNESVEIERPMHPR